MVSMIGMVFQLTRKDGILLLKRPKDHVDHANHVTKVNELIMTRGHPDHLPSDNQKRL